MASLRHIVMRRDQAEIEHAQWQGGPHHHHRLATPCAPGGQHRPVRLVAGADDQRRVWQCAAGGKAASEVIKKGVFTLIDRNIVYVCCGHVFQGLTQPSAL